MGFTAAFLDRFEVIRTLGQGGMGQVLLAKSRSDGQSVAIKVIFSGGFGDAESRHRFLMEARVTERLNHPAIVRVIEHGADGDQLYLVLELVSGGDLGSLVDSGPMEPAPFFRVARPVLAGIAFAHAQGVLHRDIKAANILIDEAGLPRIADFGIAKDLAGSGIRTATGIVMGTPAYMAPELARGGKASPATDQYALGVLLFEMLTGTRPFVAEEPLAMLRKHVEDEVPSFGTCRKNVPPALESAVRRALQKDPALRFPGVAELAAEVARVEADAGTDWRRFARRTTSSSRTMTERPTAANPVVRTSGPVPLPAVTAPTSRAGGARLAALVVAVALAGALWAYRTRLAPRPAAPPSLTVRVKRGVDRAHVSWAPPLPADRVVVSYPGGSAEASGVTSIDVPRLSGGLVQARLELALPGGAAFARAITFDEISPRAVVRDLKKLRWAGFESEKPPEPGLCSEFARRMTPPFTFRQRHPEDPIVRETRARSAAQASGLLALLDRQRDAGLTAALERAAAVLDSRDVSNEEAFAILAHAHELATLHTLADLHGLLAENEPVRFLFALPPQPLMTLWGPKLVGRGDYRRGNWKLKLIEPPASREIETMFHPGAPDEGRSPDRFYYKQKVSKVHPQGMHEGIALEYLADQVDRDCVWAVGKKLFQEPFALALQRDVDSRDVPHHGEVLLSMRASDRVHVDLELPVNRGRLCFRYPPHYRAYMTLESEAYVGWAVPAGALESGDRWNVTVSIHTAPGEGLFDDVEGIYRRPWEAKLSWFILHAVSDPGMRFTK